MISIALRVSAVQALATRQVAAAPSTQVVGPPEAVALFFSDCATNSQVGISTQDQVLQPTDSTCYTFAFNGVSQAFLAPSFTTIVYSATGCTGIATHVAQSPPLGGCHIVTGSQSYQVIAA